MMSLDLWLIRVEKRRNEAKPTTKKADDPVEKSRRSVAQHESSV